MDHAICSPQYYINYISQFQKGLEMHINTMIVQTEYKKFRPLTFYTSYLLNYSLQAMGNYLSNDCDGMNINIRKMIECYSKIIFWLYFDKKEENLNEKSLDDLCKDYCHSPKDQYIRMHNRITGIGNYLDEDNEIANTFIRKWYADMSNEYLHMPVYTDEAYIPYPLPAVSFPEYIEYLHRVYVILLQTYELLNKRLGMPIASPATPVYPVQFVR